MGILHLALSVLFLSFSVGAVDVVKTPPPTQLQQEAKEQQWTFQYQSYENEFHTGLLKDRRTDSAPKSKEFLSMRGVTYPKRFELSELAELSPIYNQGSCGSCVYNAVNTAWMDTMRVRGLIVPQLARQELMDCWAREWRCQGSYFEKVAAGALKARKLHSESDYPYRAVNGSCKQVNGDKHGEIIDWRIIDNSPKSIITALRSNYAVAVTVGADARWGSYNSGIYNACSNAGTNHQVVIIGYDCETAIDEKGECRFNSDGKLPNGIGLWRVKNSWGTGWGERGLMWSKMTSTSGRKCNNLTEEAGIIETGIEPKPPCEPQPVANAGEEKSLLIEVKR